MSSCSTYITVHIIYTYTFYTNFYIDSKQNKTWIFKCISNPCMIFLVGDVFTLCLLCQTNNVAFFPRNTIYLWTNIILYLSLVLVFGVEPDLTREGGSIPVTLTFQEATGQNVMLLPVGSSDDGAHSQNEKLNR